MVLYWYFSREELLKQEKNFGMQSSKRNKQLLL